MGRLRDYLGKYFSKHSYKESWRRDWQDTNKLLVVYSGILALLTMPLAYMNYKSNLSSKEQLPKQESIKIGHRADLNHDGNLDFVLKDIATGKEEDLYRKFIKKNGAWEEIYATQGFIKRLTDQDLNSKIRKADAEHNKSIEKAKKEHEEELKKYNIIEN
jgi:hypothetical protein